MPAFASMTKREEMKPSQPLGVFRGSYLQDIVDIDGRAGLFLLTGSQQFGTMESSTQSLAGRIGLLRLRPFSPAELQAADVAPADVDTLLF
jgi:predicted AAA+ superfamily ATPase